MTNLTLLYCGFYGFFYADFGTGGVMVPCVVGWPIYCVVSLWLFASVCPVLKFLFFFCFGMTLNKFSTAKFIIADCGF